MGIITTVFFAEISETQAAVIAASLSVLGLGLSHYYTKQKEIEDSHRQQRAAIYKKFVDDMSLLFMGQSTSKPMSEVDLLKKLRNFSTDLTFWGSKKVIGQWLCFKNNLQAFSGGNSSIKLEDIVIDMEKLYLSFRADLGQGNDLQDSQVIKMLFQDDVVQLTQLRKADSLKHQGYKLLFIFVTALGIWVVNF